MNGHENGVLQDTVLYFESATALRMIGTVEFPFDIVFLGEFLVEAGREVCAAVRRYDFRTRECREHLVTENIYCINRAVLS